MGKRIKKTAVNKNSSQIIKTKVNGNVSFSLKYCLLSEKFNYNGQEQSYHCCLLERLQALCGFTALQLKQNRSSALRFHNINWSDERVSENSFGIPSENDLVDEAYQFSLSSNKHGRIHGFFIGSVFYIVWFDPGHLLYPGS